MIRTDDGVFHEGLRAGIRLSLERDQQAMSGRDQKADCWREQNLAHHLILSHVQHESYLGERAKAKDPLRAAWAAKGLGRRATLALPDVPDALGGTPC